MGSAFQSLNYYTVEIEVTGGIVVRYIVYKLVGSYRTSNELFCLKHSWWQTSCTGLCRSCQLAVVCISQRT